MIELNKSIRLENLLSLRKKMTQQQINEEMMKIGKHLQDNDIKKNGPIVTATFAVEEANGQPLMDMEILVPLDKKAALPDEYRFKLVFHLVNAVYVRHIGNPALLQNTYSELMGFVSENNLQPITAAYNINVKELQPGLSMDEMIVDVYLGVNPSIL